MASRGRASLAEMQPQPKNDAYTVMLTISLVAMIAACILLYQELKRYPSLKPQAKDAQPPAPTVRMDTGGGDAGQFPADGGAPGGGEDKKGTSPAGGADNKATNPGGNPNP
jgi:hypothetical protein